MSEASVTWAPVACSGETYIAVPITMPVSVRCDAWAAATAVAMPKSVIFVVPPAATRRLPGLMSRCTMPAWWAASSARAAWLTMSSVASGESRPARARIADSGSPLTSSMTRYAPPNSADSP